MSRTVLLRLGMRRRLHSLRFKRADELGVLDPPDPPELCLRALQEKGTAAPWGVQASVLGKAETMRGVVLLFRHYPYKKAAIRYAQSGDPANVISPAGQSGVCFWRRSVPEVGLEALLWSSMKDILGLFPITARGYRGGL
ncbi:conserved hypothetical protein [Coccidioides posadasii str. Silveira]|uniref:Uncharacterized protein n=2 Tax=Coccidioides posadasii TaxID=199306 RepID=E9D951_COCPS|nr:conserved hypothetical protein [Coccidioides posadasii str. Silveira]KMM69996.1 hypothetical protein CPAG_06308 [Coccidioides posadasii RMSCC 3488]